MARVSECFFTKNLNLKPNPIFCFWSGEGLVGGRGCGGSE